MDVMIRWSKHRPSHAWAAGGLLVLLAPSRAGADRVHFYDGGAIDGRVEVANDLVTLHVERVAVSYPISMVRQVEWTRPPELEYAARAAELSAGDTEGHVELARWCRERHLRSAYVQELLAVARNVPLHSMAQDLARHGYVMRDGEWVSVEYHMLKEGRELYRGEWLLPEEVESRRELAREGHVASLPPDRAPAARARAPSRPPSIRREGGGPERRVRRRQYRLTIGPGGGLIDRE